MHVGTDGQLRQELPSAVRAQPFAVLATVKADGPTLAGKLRRILKDASRRLLHTSGPAHSGAGRTVARGRDGQLGEAEDGQLGINASSALEGVVVEDEARAAAIIGGKAKTLRTRSERELAGYRAALDYLLGQDWRPLNVGLLLHLHRNLFAQTKLDGGRFKESDNLVVDRSPDGSVEVRFVPVAAARTEYFTAELIDRYRAAVTEGRHHPVLLVGLFVLDLLTIHPFTDGNGRVVRALTNALLDDAGYTVGKYVSLEQLIAESADGYYAALLASTHGWHEQTNDPWPWLAYFVEVLARAYKGFEQRAASDRSTGTKQDRVREYVLEHAPQIFRIADVRAALPGVSDPTIRLTLEQLKNEGRVKPEGRGRSAAWVKAPGSQ